MHYLRPFRRTVVMGAVLCTLLGGLYQPSHAYFMAPDSRSQQGAMLTRFYYQTAVQAALHGGIDLSTDLMQRVYRLNPDNLELGLVYAEYVGSYGDTQQALSVYSNLLAHFSDRPSRSAIYYYLSMAYDDMNRPEDAVTALKQAIQLYPEEPPAGYYYDLGVLYAKLNQYDQAKNYSRKAVELSPKSAAAWNNLGYSMAKLGDLQQGYTAVQKALDLEPENANARDSMGYILFNMGRFKESILEYEKAVLLDPKMAESFLYMGKSYEETQEWSKAVDAYEKFVALTADKKEKAAVEQKLRALRGTQFLQNTGHQTELNAPENSVEHSPLQSQRSE